MCPAPLECILAPSPDGESRSSETKLVRPWDCAAAAEIADLIEGAVTRIVGLVGMTRKPLELAQVEKLLHDILVEEASHTLTAEVIQRKVAEHYRIQMSDMTSKRRMQNIAFPRQVAMYLATQLTGMSLVSIGQAFGGRDHGTVIHARKTVVNQMEVDANVRRTVEYLRAQLSMNR